MKIIQCSLYKILPEEVISEDLIEFIEQHIKEQRKFVLKSVPQGIDPALITEGIISYIPERGFPYLSDPEEDSGLFGVDILGKRLIYSPFDTPFSGRNSDRDAYQFIDTTNTYIREDFRAVLEEFKRRDFRTSTFQPNDKRRLLIQHRSIDTISTRD